MPEQQAPPEIDPIVLEMELEQAWSLMRYHQEAHDQAKEEVQKQRAITRLNYPRQQSFLSIARLLTAVDTGGMSAETFVELARQSIVQANHDTQLVEEAQARNAKAQGQL